MTPERHARARLTPPPSLPPEDMGSDDAEGSLRLAVAFDILATRTRSITPDPQILENLTYALLAVRDPSQAPQDAHALVMLARGPVGRARARLQVELDKIASGEETKSAPKLRPKEPIARVHHLLALIDQAADLLIERETLYIQKTTRSNVTRA